MVGSQCRFNGLCNIACVISCSDTQPKAALDIYMDLELKGPVCQITADVGRIAGLVQALTVNHILGA